MDERRAKVNEPQPRTAYGRSQVFLSSMSFIVINLHQLLVYNRITHTLTDWLTARYLSSVFLYRDKLHSMPRLHAKWSYFKITLKLLHGMQPCEIKHRNDFKIISVFYFACNHICNWNKIISVAEIISATLNVVENIHELQQASEIISGKITSVGHWQRLK